MQGLVVKVRSVIIVQKVYTDRVCYCFNVIRNVIKAHNYFTVACHRIRVTDRGRYGFNVIWMSKCAM